MPDAIGGNLLNMVDVQTVNGDNEQCQFVGNVYASCSAGYVTWSRDGRFWGHVDSLKGLRCEIAYRVGHTTSADAVATTSVRITPHPCLTARYKRNT